jgi:formate transporter
MSQPSDSWIPPADLAARVEEALLEKAGLSAWRMIVLGMMAGAYIALGGLFATVALAGADGQMPHGMAQVVAGVVFSLGLVLVVVAGAELFTGNALMIGPLASRSLGPGRMLRSWSIVYLANFAGSLVVAAVVFFAEVHAQGEGSVGRAAVSLAAAKTGLPFGVAFASGIAANALVCLAVWLAYSGNTTTDKIFAVLLPIAAFVAAGLEHSIANMYLIPYGLMVHAGAPAPSDATTASLTLGGLFANLIPVTLGNIVGGGIVGAAYAAVYMRGGR